MMAGRNDRYAVSTNQDGGVLLNTASALSPVMSAMPRSAMYHPNPPVDAVATASLAMSNCEPGIRGLPYKQQVAQSAGVEHRYRDLRDLKDYCNQLIAQPHHALGISHTVDRESALQGQRHTSGFARQASVSLIPADAAPTAKRPRLMSDFVQPLRIDVDSRRDGTLASSSYKPQVEAISPTLPVDAVLESQIRHLRDEFVQRINRADYEISNVDSNIEKLKRKQLQLEMAAQRPSEQPTTEPDLIVDVRNVVQMIHSDNRRKADSSHLRLTKYGPLTTLPMYVQPSDTSVHKAKKEQFVDFKKHLVAYLKKQQRATKIRDDYWMEKYDKLLQSWSKRLERLESSAKRRAKDAKMREVFEKVFPEIKKQREDKERLQRVTNARPSGYVRSEANVEQIIDGLHEQEEERRRMRNLAVIPPMLLDEKQRSRRFINTNGLLSDPRVLNDETVWRSHYWTDAEKRVFREKYLHRPKNFGYVSTALEFKSSQDCVLYYYMSKKSCNYKQLVHRHHAPPPRTRKPKSYRPTAASRDVKNDRICEPTITTTPLINEKSSDDIQLVLPTAAANGTPVLLELSKVVDDVRGPVSVDKTDTGAGVLPNCHPLDVDSARENAASASMSVGRILTDAGLVSGDDDVLKCPPKSLMNMTAADTVEVIIARAILGDQRPVGDIVNTKKTDSRASVSSDNTSDTLSADEGHDDEVRPRKLHAHDRTAAATAPNVSFPMSVVEPSRKGSLLPPLPSTTTGSVAGGIGVLPAYFVPGVIPVPLSSSGSRELATSNLRQFSASQLEAGNRQIIDTSRLPAGLPHPSVLAGGTALRVRDVIHSAIEENLLPTTGAGRGSPRLVWPLAFGPNRLPLSARPNATTAVDTSNDTVQDLSCRSRERKEAAAPLSYMSSQAAGMGFPPARKSPPPAHSHYERPVSYLQQPQAPPPRPMIDRCQDPLYHLAEVAVQRSRVEVPVEQQRPSPAAPLTVRPPMSSGITHLDREYAAGHAAGSITLGTPRQMAPVDGVHLRSALQLPRPPDPGYRPMPPVHGIRVGDGLPSANQVVELAQEALSYLGPSDSSRRAVMERVMAQVSGSYVTGNPSHTILMGDYMTAQQMQTSQHQPPPPPPIPNPAMLQHTDRRHSGPHDRILSPRVPDLLDSVRMLRAGSVTMANHIAGSPSTQHLVSPERPPVQPTPPTPPSQFNKRVLTAANVIDAIITHQINKEAPNSDVGMTGPVLNRLSDPRLRSPPLLRPGHHHPPDALDASRLGARPQPQAELYRTPVNVPMKLKSASRSVTLGEHIDEMINKDFNLPSSSTEPMSANSNSTVNGPNVDSATRNALRSFLTNSNDFSSASYTQRDQTVCTASLRPPEMAPVPAQKWDHQRFHNTAVSGNLVPMKPLTTAAAQANLSAMTSLKPRTMSEPGVLADTVGITTAMSMASPATSSDSMVPVTAPSVVSMVTRTDTIHCPVTASSLTKSSPGQASTGQSSTTTEQPCTSTDRLVSSVVAEKDRHDSVPAAVNWKLKMARTHMQQQELDKQQGTNTSTTADVTTTTAATVCTTSSSHLVSSAVTLTTATATSISDDSSTAMSQTHSTSTVSGAVSTPVVATEITSTSTTCSLAVAAATTGSLVSPRSPQVKPAVTPPEKALSTIAATHQTMTSLLSIRPGFSVEKVVTFEPSTESATVVNTVISVATAAAVCQPPTVHVSSVTTSTATSTNSSPDVSNRDMTATSPAEQVAVSSQSDVDATVTVSSAPVAVSSPSPCRDTGSTELSDAGQSDLADDGNLVIDSSPPPSASPSKCVSPSPSTPHVPTTLSIVEST